MSSRVGWIVASLALVSFVAMAGSAEAQSVRILDVTTPGENQPGDPSGTPPTLEELLLPDPPRPRRFRVTRIDGLRIGGRFEPALDTASTSFTNNIEVRWKDPGAPAWKLWAAPDRWSSGMCVSHIVYAIEYFRSFHGKGPRNEALARALFPEGVPASPPRLRDLTEQVKGGLERYARVVAAGQATHVNRYQQDRIDSGKTESADPVPVPPGDPVPAPVKTGEAKAAMVRIRKLIEDRGAAIITWALSDRVSGHAILGHAIHRGEVMEITDTGRTSGEPLPVFLIELWDPNVPVPVTGPAAADWNADARFLLYFPDRKAFSFPATYLGGYEGKLQAGTYLEPGADLNVIENSIEVDDTLDGLANIDYFENELSGYAPGTLPTLGLRALEGAALPGPALMGVTAVTGAELTRRMAEHARFRENFVRDVRRRPAAREK